MTSNNRWSWRTWSGWFMRSNSQESTHSSEMSWERANSSGFTRVVSMFFHFFPVDSQESFTLKSGAKLEEGDGLFVLTRAAGTSEEFFTRGKEFVPERYIRGTIYFGSQPWRRQHRCRRIQLVACFRQRAPLPHPAPASFARVEKWRAELRSRARRSKPVLSDSFHGVPNGAPLKINVASDGTCTHVSRLSVPSRVHGGMKGEVVVVEEDTSVPSPECSAWNESPAPFFFVFLLSYCFIVDDTAVDLFLRPRVCCEAYPPPPALAAIGPSLFHVRSEAVRKKSERCWAGRGQGSARETSCKYVRSIEKSTTAAISDLTSVLLLHPTAQVGGSRPNAKRPYWEKKRQRKGWEVSTTRQRRSCLSATVQEFAQGRYFPSDFFFFFHYYW